MRYNVSVDVPCGQELAYTLYAQGAAIDSFMDDDGKFAHFKFPGGSIFCLFYAFAGFRRGYIATDWQDAADGEPVALPGVNRKLCVLFTAKGRKFDHLKRALYLLTRDDEFAVYRLPLLFWYRLAGLIQHFGAKKSDVLHLYEQFKRTDT